MSSVLVSARPRCAGARRGLRQPLRQRRCVPQVRTRQATAGASCQRCIHIAARQGQELRRLHLGTATRDAIAAAPARTSLPSATPVQRSQVDTAVREVATTASAGRPARAAASTTPSSRATCSTSSRTECALVRGCGSRGSRPDRGRAVPVSSRTFDRGGVEDPAVLRPDGGIRTDRRRARGRRRTRRCGRPRRRSAAPRAARSARRPTSGRRGSRRAGRPSRPRR